jgi:hypothetical protein
MGKFDFIEALVVSRRTGGARAAEELGPRGEPMIQRLRLVEPSSQQPLDAVRRDHRRRELVGLKDREVAGRRKPLAQALRRVAGETGRDGSDAP